MSEIIDASPVCSCTVIRQDVVKRVQNELPDSDSCIDMATLFKCLGDPTRLTIVHCLLKEELCVCEIGTLLEMSTPAISHHLKILRQLRLVKYRREGKVVFYAIADEHIATIVSQALKHVCE